MKKIMIVDDSIITRKQISRDLESAGYEVIQGEDGLQGIELIQVNKDVELIICDINMPNMDGLTMCDRIHKISEFSEIPILMMTTESNAEMKSIAKKSGVIGWILKPYTATTLLKVVGKIVAKDS